MKNPPTLWIYNYDLELELGKQATINQTSPRFSPWYFLNRTANHYLPFTSSGDAICCYEKPDADLLSILEAKIGKRAKYFILSSLKDESNSILNDLLKTENAQEKIQNYQLKFWGISPACSTLLQKNNLKRDELNTAFHSKVFNAEQRKKVLADSFQIPTLIFKYPFNDKELLSQQLKTFYQENGDFLVKNCFGTSGKLTNTVQTNQFSHRTVGRWLSWIRHSGGIVIEKKMPIEKEVSLQFSITEDKIDLLTETTLYTNLDGSYQGTLINKEKRYISKNNGKAINDFIQIYQQKGYRGPLGMDLLRTPKGEYKLLETNARYTMGRVAYEWSQCFPNRSLGYYRNLNIKGALKCSLRELLKSCIVLEKEFNADIAIVNFCYSKAVNRTLVSLFIALDDEKQISQILEKIIKQVG